MRDPINEYLTSVREELYRLADNHDDCDEFTHCHSDEIEEAADLIDDIIVCRQSNGGIDWDTMNKMHKEQELADEQR